MVPLVAANGKSDDEGRPVQRETRSNNLTDSIMLELSLAEAARLHFGSRGLFDATWIVEKVMA